VDYVKIDGRYVQGLAEGNRDAVILKHVVAMCREIGLATIAEMVETRDAARVCKELGVNLGQGWVFSKPLPEPKWSPPKAPHVRGRRQGEFQEWG